MHEIGDRVTLTRQGFMEVTDLQAGAVLVGDLKRALDDMGLVHASSVARESESRRLRFPNLMTQAPKVGFRSCGTGRDAPVKEVRDEKAAVLGSRPCYEARQRPPVRTRDFMARQSRISTRLSAASLVHLGAPRLADLLIEAGAGNANLKRRLRLELAAEVGADTLALEIDKRLSALAAARPRVSWRKRGELIDDLNVHRLMIVERLAREAPGEALAVLVRWFDLYPGLVARVKDTKGELAAAFEAAAPDLFTLAEATNDGSFRDLADAFARRPQDYSRWIAAAGEALAPDTARRMIDHLEVSATKSPAGRNLVRRLADRAQDLDLWLSLVTPEQAASPDIAADIARRLLGAGRTAEARAALEAALSPSPLNRRWTLGGKPKDGAPRLTTAWEAASIDLLDAEGSRQEAQDLRWSLFERDLSASVLRDFLSRLPDFDDVEALDRAFAYAAKHPDFEAAMRLLMDWPAHREAAALVLSRPREARQTRAMSGDWASRLVQRFPEASEILSG